jgi:hypothetical protein
MIDKASFILWRNRWFSSSYFSFKRKIWFLSSFERKKLSVGKLITANNTF